MPITQCILIRCFCSPSNSALSNTLLCAVSCKTLLRYVLRRWQARTSYDTTSAWRRVLVKSGTVNWQQKLEVCRRCHLLDWLHPIHVVAPLNQRVRRARYIHPQSLQSSEGWKGAPEFQPLGHFHGIQFENTSFQSLPDVYRPSIIQTSTRDMHPETNQGIWIMEEEIVERIG